MTLDPGTWAWHRYCHMARRKGLTGRAVKVEALALQRKTQKAAGRAKHNMATLDEWFRSLTKGDPR